MESPPMRPLLPWRALVPWWFVAGAALIALLPLVVPLWDASTATMIGWAPMTAAWMRGRRDVDRERAEQGLPPARPPRGVQLRLAAAGTAALLGIGFLLSSVWPQPFRPIGLVWSAAFLLVFAGLLLLELRSVRRGRTRSAAPAAEER